jgi:SWI/SNF-related matrix-associated actin-dependent regulator 1 of chromatin subfamily A
LNVPAYLNDPGQADYYYGDLKYDEGTDSWVIEGEPCAVELAKRLFPGSSGRGQGFARFKNNRRSVGDLNWLMMRYPLRVMDTDKWKWSWSGAIEHAVKSMVNIKPPPTSPPKAFFKGELIPFQQEGLSYLLHNRRTVLGDEMGLGKTVQALAFLSATETYPALVVAPAHLMLHWTKKIKEFLRFPPRPGQMSLLDEAESLHVLKGLRPYELPEANIYLVHYLLLRGWKNYLPDFGFKTIIFDEIQELRHNTTEKYSAASLIAENAENVIGLSGTPIYNKGGEIWKVMNIIDYHCLGDWDGFTREWCHGYGSEIVVKPDLLGDYLKREGLLLRRRKAEVLKELPPKRRVVQTIDFDAGRYGELIQRAVNKAMAIDGIKDTFEKGRAVRDVVNETRQATGISKAPYVAAFVKMLLEAGEKVLLFAYHHAVHDIFMDELRDFNPRKITGRETAREKDLAIERFKNNETPLIIISLRASAGIDGLQSASSVVFGELDWSPAVHSQAEDRAHRMGQLDSILCYYLVCEEGTDEDMQEALGLKVSQFVGLMGDKQEGEEDRLLAQVEAGKHMQRIVEKLKEKGHKPKRGSGAHESHESNFGARAVGIDAGTQPEGTGDQVLGYIIPGTHGDPCQRQAAE